MKKSLLAFTFLFLIAGCGGNDHKTPPTSQTSPTQPNSSTNNSGISISISSKSTDDFSFAQDTGSRNDKVIGTFVFELANMTTDGFIRDLDSTNMSFLEREFGTENNYLSEVEATQSSSIEKTSLDVIYLIDTSYSVVESTANDQLIDQANALANKINSSNDTSTPSQTRYRVFGDTVGELQTSLTSTPFGLLNFEAQGGGTALYEAIQKSLEDLSGSEQPLLFVFTDGRENASAAGYDVERIQQTAETHGIPIYIAGLGDVDSTILDNIATQSGGDFFKAKSVSELPKVFDQILQSIPVTYTAIYKPTYRSGHYQFQFVVNYNGATDAITDDFDVEQILNRE